MLTFEIIGKKDNHFDLLIHESLVIKGDTHSLNSQTSSIPIVSFYVSISVLFTVPVSAILGLVLKAKLWFSAPSAGIAEIVQFLSSPRPLVMTLKGAGGI